VSELKRNIQILDKITGKAVLVGKNGIIITAYNIKN